METNATSGTVASGDPWQRVADTLIRSAQFYSPPQRAFGAGKVPRNCYYVPYAFAGVFMLDTFDLLGAGSGGGIVAAAVRLDL